MTHNFRKLFFLMTLLAGITLQPVALFSQEVVISSDRFDLSLAANLNGPATAVDGYLSGRDINFSITIKNEGTIAANDIVIHAAVPASGKILSPGWVQDRSGSASYSLAALATGDAITFPLQYLPTSPDEAMFHRFTIQINAATNSSGITDADSTPGQLSNPEAGPEDDEVQFTVDRYLVLNRIIDTCINVLDSTATALSRFISVGESIQAGLSSPIDLSPVGPILISAHKCPAFQLKAPKKPTSKQKKDRCSCFRYVFGGTEYPNFPTTYKSDGRRLKTCIELPSGSKQGDTITISVRTVDGMPLKRVMLRNGKGDILDFQEKVPIFNYTKVLESDADTLQLYLQTGRRFFIFPRKQYCFVEVNRRSSPLTFTNGAPPTKVRDTVEVRYRKIVADTDAGKTWSVILRESKDGLTILHRILESQYPGKSNTLVQDTISSDTCKLSISIKEEVLSTATAVRINTDTLLYQVSDLSARVVGQRNLLGIRTGNMEVKVPLQLNQLEAPARDSLVAIAYWIGIGTNPISTYNALLEEVPEEWAQPGVSAPLAAYGLGHPVVLPDLGLVDSLFNLNMVTYDFVNNRNRDLLLKGRPHRSLISRSAKRPNYGLLTGDSLQALIDQAIMDDQLGKRVISFSMAFANKHPINTFSVNLIMVAYYQVTVPGLKWSSP